MSSSYRHHVAHPVVVLVPFESGSPKEASRQRPPRYPSNQREPWRPQRNIPPRPSKAAATARWLDGVAKQEAEERVVSFLLRRPPKKRARRQYRAADDPLRHC
jgi:hypothetical protein